MRMRRGSQAVEFALVMPVFVVLLAAIIDFGWYFRQCALVQDAVRDAARVGATTQDNTAAKEWGCSILTNGGFTTTGGTACNELVVTNINCGSYQCVKAYANNLTFQPLFGFIRIGGVSNGIGSSTTIEASMTMYVELN